MLNFEYLYLFQTVLLFLSKFIDNK